MPVILMAKSEGLSTGEVKRLIIKKVNEKRIVVLSTPQAIVKLALEAGIDPNTIDGIANPAYPFVVIAFLPRDKRIRKLLKMSKDVFENTVIMIVEDEGNHLHIHSYGVTDVEAVINILVEAYEAFIQERIGVDGVSESVKES